MTRLRGTELIRRRIGRLLLRRRFKVRSNITVDLDDILGQQVPHCLCWIRWHVRAEYIVEAPIFSDYDYKVTDRRAWIPKPGRSTAVVNGFAAVCSRSSSGKVEIT